MLYYQIIVFQGKNLRYCTYFFCSVFVNYIILCFILIWFMFFEKLEWVISNLICMFCLWFRFQLLISEVFLSPDSLLFDRTLHRIWLIGGNQVKIVDYITKKVRSSKKGTGTILAWFGHYFIDFCCLQFYHFLKLNVRKHQCEWKI